MARASSSRSETPPADSSFAAIRTTASSEDHSSGRLTKVPRPRWICTTFFDRRMRTASRTVSRLTPNAVARSPSGGRGDPTAYVPSTTSPSRRSASSSGSPMVIPLDGHLMSCGSYHADIRHQMSTARGNWFRGDAEPWVPAPRAPPDQREREADGEQHRPGDRRPPRGVGRDAEVHRDPEDPRQAPGKQRYLVVPGRQAAL